MRELETREQRTRTEVAASLRELADQLDGGGAVTLEFGAQSVTFEPAETIAYALETESEAAETGTGTEQSIEVEMRWEQETGTAGDEATGTGEENQ